MMANEIEIDRSQCRIFVVDDELSVCKGLSRLLHASGYIAETFTSAEDFLQREPYDGIACIILDVYMPQLSGTELQLRLNEQNNFIPVIFLTAHGDVPMAVESMKLGADDFLSKPVDEKTLLSAVDRALLRHCSLRSEQLKSSEVQARLGMLTPRELETLQLILGGATNKQIADELFISEKTVKIHRSNAMHKLNVSSAAELGWVCSFSSIAAKKIQTSLDDA
jgi:FixJ family two-component response regulator